MSGHWHLIDITESKWENLLQDKNVFKEKDIELMLALYNSGGRERASVLAEKLNISNYRVITSQVVQLGKRIVKKLPNIKYPTIFDEFRVTPKIADVPIQYKYIPFEGEDDDDNPGHIYWLLRLELENALKKLINMHAINNDELNVAEIPNNQFKGLYEGTKKQITVNAYERNRKARNICIEQYGYRCIVCGFDFEKEYGIIGRNFIEVHHIKPLHEIDESYCIDPIADLRPVCPNCHAMLHRANITIEDRKKIIKMNFA